MKGCSTTPAIREMQIKSTMRYHFTQIRMDIIKNQTRAGKDERKRNLSALLVGMQTGAAAMEKSMEFPQSLKIELPFTPAILLLGIYPKNPETQIQKKGTLPFMTTWMELESIMLQKRSCGERLIPCDLTYNRNLKNKTHKK